MGMGMLHGFSYAAASPMNVMLGRKAEAYANITHLMDEYITANTMYYEGKAYPCGETPPAAASALMDWMLMEWGGVLHVFAGIDDDKIVDAAFAGLLAPGGIEVAARRKGNVTSFVELTNARGVAASDMLTVSLSVDGMPLPWGASSKVSMRVDGDGVVHIDLATLPKGESVMLYSAGNVPTSFQVIPSGHGNHSDYNHWGLKGGQPPPGPPIPPAPSPVSLVASGHTSPLHCLATPPPPTHPNNNNNDNNNLVTPPRERCRDALHLGWTRCLFQRP